MLIRNVLDKLEPLKTYTFSSNQTDKKISLSTISKAISITNAVITALNMVELLGNEPTDETENAVHAAMQKLDDVIKSTKNPKIKGRLEAIFRETLTPEALSPAFTPDIIKKSKYAIIKDLLIVAKDSIPKDFPSIKDLSEIITYLEKNEQAYYADEYIEPFESVVKEQAKNKELEMLHKARMENERKQHIKEMEALYVERENEKAEKKKRRAAEKQTHSIPDQMNHHLNSVSSNGSLPKSAPLASVAFDTDQAIKPVENPKKEKSSNESANAQQKAAVNKDSDESKKQIYSDMVKRDLAYTLSSPSLPKSAPLAGHSIFRKRATKPLPNLAPEREGCETPKRVESFQGMDFVKMS